ncbi:hypothetical protein BDN70DRAFT_872944 [Pholiota conissans]|uniref:BTB domain-containing protein n=1 Tax=Pholiota conissans TaxID=109636 RepID=A0A9P5ZBC7_9AGAR|nr:hypothetical protein BDN70DRAFT_872944 [Pholiota conissans]
MMTPSTRFAPKATPFPFGSDIYSNDFRTNVSADSRSQHHERFYLTSKDFGSAIFEVGGRLYNVHTYFFIHESKVFKAMFDFPACPGKPQDGVSDDKPIHIPEVTCAEFEALLEFFYDGMFSPHGLKFIEKKPRELEIPSHTHTSPTSVQNQEVKARMYNLLSISLRFGFDRITKEIVKAIDSQGASMDPAQKVIIALKHDVLKHWVQPAFTEIVTRPSSLTCEDIKRLGPKRSAVICKWREENGSGRNANMSTFGGGSFGLKDINGNVKIPNEFYGE